MCGIVGIYSSRNSEIENRLVVGLKSQTHRGPDDQGVLYLKNDGVGLAQNRLSIIDTSFTGHQPMTTTHHGNEYAIVYNGEVYNYQELKNELIALGYSFLSTSDTEVILKSYIEWGKNCVSKFRGMFALAIWDGRNKFLFIARDRFGIKPFLYSNEGGEFIFASEVRTLLKMRDTAGPIDSAAIIDFLLFGSIRQPRSLYKSIKWLPKAHYGIVTTESVQLVRYWDLSEAVGSSRKQFAGIDYEEAKTELRQNLEEATRLHLISDVKVGAFLSGGIDSTAVVALMAKYYPAKLNTFTLGFESSLTTFPGESEIASKTAKQLNTEHHTLTLTKSYFLDRIPDFFSAQDQPSIDGLNTYLISEFVSTDVKVVLSGLGGDELFLGYAYVSELMHRSTKAYSGEWVDFAAPLLDRLPRRWSRKLTLRYGNSIQRLLTIRRYLLLPDLEKIAFQWGVTKKEIAQYHDTLLDELALEIDKEAELMDNVSLFELNNYIPNTLLRDSDVMAMRHHKEIRPILLDHKLVEYALALPANYKLNKKILKDCLADLIPDFVLKGKKLGFELPYDLWLSDLINNAKFYGGGSFKRHFFYLHQFLNSK
jgi:asparagine synthase (glutamine-hydrolysing)